MLLVHPNKATLQSARTAPYWCASTPRRHSAAAGRQPTQVLPPQEFLEGNKHMPLSVSHAVWVSRLLAPASCSCVPGRMA